MAYKIIGSVLAITPAQTFPSKNGNSYTKRDIIITVWTFDTNTGERNVEKDNTPKFTFFGKQCELIDRFKPGDIVTIFFDIKGNIYNKNGQTEYFNEVKSKYIDFFRPVIQPTAPQQYPTPQAPPPSQQGLGQTFAQSPAMNAIQNAFPNAEIISEGVVTDNDDLPF